MVPLKKLFEFLPPERLEKLAASYKLDAKNSVKITGPALFLCLMTGLLHHPELSQRLLEETYHQQTGKDFDHSSFGKCLGRMDPDYFADIFRQLHQKVQPLMTPGTKQALKLRIVDATSVTLSAKLLSWGLKSRNGNPDKARCTIKSVVELSEGLPNLLKVCDDKTENSDSVALGATMKLHSQPGDFWVFDKGCHGRQRLWEIHQEKAFWLTPLTQQQTRTLRTLFCLPEGEMPVGPPLSETGHFVVVGVEQVVFENSHESKKSQAQWSAMPLLLVHGRRFDVRTKTWKELVLMTNLPLDAEEEHAGPYTWTELGAVYQSRWDIEVFFKFIKQHLNYSHLTSRNENGIKVMIYMSLIVAVLMIWYKEQTGIDRGWRSVKFWLEVDVREWTQQVLQGVRLAPDGGA
jgi:transposase